jgi:hypothetical protein
LGSGREITDRNLLLQGEKEAPSDQWD